MATYKVYAKSAMCLHSKVGAYAYIIDDLRAQRTGHDKFKSKIRTLTQADCAAFVNALSILSRTAAAEDVTILEVYTDSGKVAELLEVSKAEKHCEDIARFWFMQVKPAFKNLKEIRIKKLERDKVVPGEANYYKLNKCATWAQGIVNQEKELVK